MDELKQGLIRLLDDWTVEDVAKALAQIMNEKAVLWKYIDQEPVATPFGQKKVIIEISYRDLENLISTTYGRTIDLVASEEWDNDSVYDFDVTGEVEKHQEAALLQFIGIGSTGFGIADILLDDLARQGVIEKGEYHITVCW